MNIENIEGITVLGSRVIKDYSFITVGLVVFSAIFLLILTVYLFIDSVQSGEIGLAIATCFISVLVICLIVAGTIGILNMPKTKNCYDIYIENADSMQKLYDRYEIIEANGNVYTVTEKME